MKQDKAKSPKEITVLKLQAISILLLAAVFFSDFVPETAAAAIAAVLLAALTWQLYLAKKIFGRDFAPVAFFFIGLLVIIIASAAIKALPIEEINLRFQLLMALFVAIAVFFLAFRKMFSKGFVEGKVIWSNATSATVETVFDFPSGINSGKYTVKAGKKHPEGKTVKVRVSQGFWGRKPSEIIE